MKLIDKEGKVFGKLHIFDIVFIALIVLVIVGAVNKFSGGNVINFASDSKKVKVQLEIETLGYREEYFKSLQVENRLTEDKRYLEGVITNIEIHDHLISLLDQTNGENIIAPHPYLKKARITAEVLVNYDDPIYKMGKEELIVGRKFFFTTETVKLASEIIAFKVIE